MSVWKNEKELFLRSQSIEVRLQTMLCIVRNTKDEIRTGRERKMNALIENNDITEMICGSNFSYILSDNNTFLSTEYKVLQNQTNSCFVKCMKMLYNGKIQLFYLTNGLRSFADLIPTADVENFLIIVSNLLANIVEVKNNGFLSCQNIDIDFQRIYIDPATYKVSLVYLPLSKKIFSDYASFENEIRTKLIKLISELPSLVAPKTVQFASDLSNGMLTVEDLYSHAKGGKRTKSVNIPNQSRTYQKSGLMRIIAMNAPARIEIDVTKDEFVIGKKAESCDGVVGFNKMISRRHCKICRQGDTYTITDLQSANGTFVNKRRLLPGQPHPIHNGDVIRLANSDFQVVWEG